MRRKNSNRNIKKQGLGFEFTVISFNNNIMIHEKLEYMCPQIFSMKHAQNRQNKPFVARLTQ